MAYMDYMYLAVPHIPKLVNHSCAYLLLYGFCQLDCYKDCFLHAEAGLNVNMLSYQYRNSHFKDKMVSSL